jgi:hypothetical protein
MPFRFGKGSNAASAALVGAQAEQRGSNGGASVGEHEGARGSFERLRESASTVGADERKWP